MLVLGVILVLAAAALAVRLAPLVSEARRARRLTAALPGPPGYPLVGNLFAIACSLHELYGRFQDFGRRYGPVYRLWLGPLTAVIVQDPVDMEVAMTSDKTLGKAVFYSAMVAFTGKGLVTLGGPVWRRHRKAISPSMHLDVLKDFVDVFHARGVSLADTLGELADSGRPVVDMTPLCGDAANGTILKTVMSSGTDEERTREYSRKLPALLDHVMYRITRVWLLTDWAYSLLRARYTEYIGLIKYFRDYHTKVVHEKKEELRVGGGSVQHPERKRQALLDHVLSSKEGAALTEEELVEEVMTIVSAASATSMDTLSLAAYTLAVRQDVQDRVRQEVDDILGEDRERTLKHSDLVHLQYTERFIKEVLRYYSIAPLLARYVSDDLTLPSGHTLPRGSSVVFWLPFTHRNPKWFPEPDKFDPDRFLPENSRGRHPFAYVPFSAGPRNCVGQRYAMMFMKTVLAALVARLRFEVPAGGPQRLEDIPLTMNITVAAHGGANVRVRRRAKI